MLQTEIEYSKSLIAKAERRLRHQKQAIRALGADAPRSDLELANEVAARLEARLALMQRQHRHLLDEAKQRPSSSRC